MCKPDGLPNVFIEDSFLSLDEIYGKLPPEELGNLEIFTYNL
jgi:hypothetical protein